MLDQAWFDTGATPRLIAASVLGLVIIRTPLGAHMDSCQLAIANKTSISCIYPTFELTVMDHEQLGSNCRRAFAAVSASVLILNRNRGTEDVFIISSGSRTGISTICIGNSTRVQPFVFVSQGKVSAQFDMLLPLSGSHSARADSSGAGAMILQQVSASSH